MKLVLSNTDGRVLNWGEPPWSNIDELSDYTIIDIGNQATPSGNLWDYRYVGGVFIFDELPPTEQEANRTDVEARFLLSQLANKTPQQIYTAMQNSMDGWASLADAKSDLREWLPLLAAIIAWKVV